MASKLKITKVRARKNIPTYVAKGKKHNVIVDIVDNNPIVTKFNNA